MTLNSDIKQELDELAITTRNAGEADAYARMKIAKKKYQ